jgi:hypothetical protein
MIEIVLSAVSMQGEVLGRNIADLNHKIQAGTGHERLARNHLLTLAHNVRITVAMLPALGAPNALRLGKHLIRRLESVSIQWNAVAAAEALTLFHEEFLNECRLHRWIRIDARYARVLKDAHPWGELVSRVFPDADTDIRSAGLSLAVELNTAAVFHLMRVAELGLKWLATQLKVKLRENRKPLPVDEAMWNKIIDGLNSRIKTTRQMTAGPRKRARLEMYAAAAQQCDYMKDIWRNNVSHSHRSYTAREAQTAMKRVRDFMQSLAQQAAGQ